jgi:NAD(P)-dependent dehydrogenase (short-subunit alcohol dehydrogenase family)
MGRVSGKVAIVTGAATGIGAATSRLLAREGARVIATDLEVNTAREVVEAIRASGGDAETIRHDVSLEADWRAVIERAIELFGRLDIVVNNAGVAPRNDDIEHQTLEDWRRVMSVNLDGVFLGTKYGISAMRRSKSGGSIVNLSSIFGIASSPTAFAYSASKGGVRLLTKSAALHCARSGYGIRVNSIHPGYIWTPMLVSALRSAGELDAERSRVERTTPLGHVGEPEDVAYGVLYLSSEESQFVTGTELVIDGGYLTQ